MLSSQTHRKVAGVLGPLCSLQGKELYAQASANHAAPYRGLASCALAASSSAVLTRRLLPLAALPSPRTQAAAATHGAALIAHSRSRRPHAALPSQSMPEGQCLVGRGRIGCSHARLCMLTIRGVHAASEPRCGVPGTASRWRGAARVHGTCARVLWVPGRRLLTTQALIYPLLRICPVLRLPRMHRH